MVRKRAWIISIIPIAVSVQNLIIPSGNKDLIFDGVWRPGGRTYPGDMPEDVMKDISTKRGEYTWNIVN